MRATAQDREAAALMGIDINRTIAIAFLIGGGLAGAAGMIALYYNNSARFQMGFRYGLFAFTAAVLGGIGNLAGAVMGGFFIGIVWAMSDGFVKQYISDWGPQWTTTVIFGLLVLIMIFKPTGLFGSRIDGQGLMATNILDPRRLTGIPGLGSSEESRSLADIVPDHRRLCGDVHLPVLRQWLGINRLGSWMAIFVTVILAMGLNIVVGYAGLLDLGYAAFFAIGAYTIAFLTSPASFFVQEWLDSRLLPELLGRDGLRLVRRRHLRRAPGCADAAASRRLPRDRDARFRRDRAEFFLNADKVTNGTRASTGSRRRTRSISACSSCRLDRPISATGTG